MSSRRFRHGRPQAQLVVELTSPHLDQVAHRGKHLVEGREAVVRFVEGRVDALDERPPSRLLDPGLATILCQARDGPADEIARGLALNCRAVSATSSSVRISSSRFAASESAPEVSAAVATGCAAGATGSPAAAGVVESVGGCTGATASAAGTAGASSAS